MLPCQQSISIGDLTGFAIKSVRYAKNKRTWRVSAKTHYDHPDHKCDLAFCGVGGEHPNELCNQPGVDRRGNYPSLSRA